MTRQTLQDKLKTDGYNLAALARQMGMSPELFWQKVKNESFTIKEYRKLAGTTNRPLEYFITNEVPEFSPITLTGPQIKTKLLRDGYTVKKLARKMRVTTSNLYIMFKGDHIRDASLQKIAKSIGRDMTYFEARTINQVPENTYLTGREIQRKLQSERFVINRLAQKMGVTPQNLYRIFSSENVRPATIQRLAKTTGRPVEWFMPIHRDTLSELKEQVRQLQDKIAELENQIEERDKELAIYHRALQGIKA